jgi:hypothetical protein
MYSTGGTHCYVDYPCGVESACTPNGELITLRSQAVAGCFGLLCQKEVTACPGGMVCAIGSPDSDIMGKCVSREQACGGNERLECSPELQCIWANLDAGSTDKLPRMDACAAAKAGYYGLCLPIGRTRSYFGDSPCTLGAAGSAGVGGVAGAAGAGARLALSSGAAGTGT